MTVSTYAKKILDSKQTGLMVEAPPVILAGQGTPAGAIPPFKEAQKGSLYMQTDAADDASHVWQKVDEGGDNSDWSLITEAAVTDLAPSQFVDEARLNYVRSKEFDIDIGAATTADDIVFVAVKPLTVTSIDIIYTEATDGAGAAGANVKVGTTVGGNDIAEAQALEVSKSIGYVKSMTIADGAVAEDELISIRLTGIAATDTGKFVVQIGYMLDDPATA
jgi:hypothetical protein